MSALRDDMLFNCCTDYREPDWRTFKSLAISGVRDIAEESGDGTNCVQCDDAEAQFWTVYGLREERGDAEAITDAPTRDRALVLAGMMLGLARARGARLEVPSTLAPA